MYIIYMALTVVFTFPRNKPYEIKQKMKHRSFLIQSRPECLMWFIESHTKITHKLLMEPKRSPQYYVCPDGLKSTSNILFSPTARERENSNCVNNFWINHTAIKTVINYIIILSLLKILIEVQALIIFNKMYVV